MELQGQSGTGRAGLEGDSTYLKIKQVTSVLALRLRPPRGIIHSQKP